MIIFGNTVSTNMPRTDYAQSDPAKADFLKNKPPEALPKTGGAMTGSLHMGNNTLDEIPDPVSDDDAANKGYVDAKKTEAINEAIAKAKAHTDAQKTKRVSAILTAAGWSASAPYTQSITVDGLTDTLFARTYPDFPENAAQDEAFREETAKITSCKRNGSTVTYRCALEKPETDIPVVVEVST